MTSQNKFRLTLAKAYLKCVFFKPNSFVLNNGVELEHLRCLIRFFDHKKFKLFDSLLKA